MGYSVVAAFALVTIAGLYGLHIVSDSTFDANEEMEGAFGEAQEETLRLQQARINITGVSFSGSTIFVDVRNEGGTTFDSSKVKIVINGALATVDSYRINGLPSTVWAGGMDVEFRLTGGSPNHVLVVTTEGIQHIWRR